jgi:lipopolysaccharide export system ATP-binding protein
MLGLYADSIRVSFAGRPVLTDMHINCLPGETVALMGRNGSGKSTLLKILFGIQTAETLHLKVDGKVLLKPYLFCRRLSYLPQDSFLPERLAVNTIINQIKHLPIPETLLAFKKRPCGLLSGGEKRLLEILFVLSRSTPYILLDEPFNGCSPLIVEEIKDLLRRAAENGKGLIITDHLHHHVWEIRDRSYLIKDGAMHQVQEKEDLRRWGYLP